MEEEEGEEGEKEEEEMEEELEQQAEKRRSRKTAIVGSTAFVLIDILLLNETLKT